jgi:hypothetical protein
VACGHAIQNFEKLDEAFLFKSVLARHTLDYGPGNTADFESEALLTEGKAGFLGNTGRYASHALELPRVWLVHCFSRSPSSSCAACFLAASPSPVVGHRARYGPLFMLFHHRPDLLLSSGGIGTS